MRKGFTLIELLLLLAIITALTAILLTVTNHIIGASKRKTCTANTRCITVALLQYIQDYDGRTPPGNATDMQAHSHPWASVRQYLKSSEVFICPSDHERNCCSLQAGVDGYWGVEWVEFPCSYGYGNRTGEVLLQEMRCPAQTLAMCEMIERPYADYVGGDHMLMDGSNRRYTLRHNGSMNIGYWDGHVGCVLGDRLSTVQLSP